MKKENRGLFLRQARAGSLILFLTQLFDILLIIFGWFFRKHPSKRCDE